MKFNIYLVSIITLFVIFALLIDDKTAIQKSTDTFTNQLSTSTIALNAKLSTFSGKYPNEVNLLEIEEIKNKTILISNQEFYNNMVKFWNVESPIEIKDDILFAQACEAHNCGDNSFVLSVNLKTNEYYVANAKDKKIFDYSDAKVLNNSAFAWKFKNILEWEKTKEQYKPPVQYNYNQYSNYNGYSGYSSGSGHNAGYEWADEKGIDNEDDCGGNSNSFIEGCQEYVQENYPENSCEDYNEETEECED